MPPPPPPPPSSTALPPLELAPDESQQMVQANLMPFTIDYTGPAPIDSFLVLRPAPPNPNPDTQADNDNDNDNHSHNHNHHLGQSDISAFRGRTIQSLQLPLPPGYVGNLVEIQDALLDPQPRQSQQPSAPPAPKRPKTTLPPPRPPAKMQKFSIDSDDDHDDEEQDEDEQAQVPEAQAEPQHEQSLPAKGHIIRPVAQIQGDAIRVWGADGPVDCGDDVFFRTLQEWVSVVSAEVSVLLPLPSPPASPLPTHPDCLPSPLPASRSVRPGQAVSNPL